jgi:hypothetical protein
VDCGSPAKLTLDSHDWETGSTSVILSHDSFLVDFRAACCSARVSKTWPSEELIPDASVRAQYEERRNRRPPPQKGTKQNEGQKESWCVVFEHSQYQLTEGGNTHRVVTALTSLRLSPLAAPPTSGAVAVSSRVFHSPNCCFCVY